MDRIWKSETELALMLIQRGHFERRGAYLTAETANFVGLRLMRNQEKPTRDEVAKLLCQRQCTNRCYECTGRANVIVSAYGFRNDPNRTRLPPARWKP